MMEICKPGVRCVEYMHPHIVGKVADACLKIRKAKVTREQQIFATILLLQTVTNHTRYKKHRVWKAQELKRLWQFEHGDWHKIISNIKERAAKVREDWGHTTKAENIMATVRKGHARDIIFGGAHNVIPTLEEVQGTIMPNRCIADEDIEEDEDWLSGRLTNWNHAFAVIDFFSNGDYKVEVVEIIDGKTTLWGEVLDGS